jgi:hypothetical protein
MTQSFAELSAKINKKKSMRSSEINRGDAVTQEAMSRLNHRIKQQ